MEDILDKFLVHVEEFLDKEDDNSMRYIFGGELEGVQKLKSLIGKRAYNEEFVDEKGRTRVRLKIE